ncbi:unnamed protein product [Linum trigynum]|uniref:F-box domain-containing protein n=1 Tax=Linum trigynum TaxID=586398 RepID=A0AAV2D1J0_9ROSI
MPVVGERRQARGRFFGRWLRQLFVPPNVAVGQRWLPEEIQAKILSRLSTPASIARSRCVSKSWRRLLSDDGELIANALLSDGDPEFGPEARVITFSTHYEFYSVATRDTLRPVSSGTPPGPITQPAIRVRGCCNGIFCICDFFVEKQFILWNPTTCEAKASPPIPSPPVLGGGGFDRRPDVGFGFDPKTGDYKVLVSFSGRESRPPLEAIHVYSLREDTWRRWRRKKSAPLNAGQSFGPVVSRATGYVSRCHWIDTRFGKNSFLLTTFDASSENITQLELPMPKVEGQEAWWRRESESSYHMTRDGSCLVAIYSGTRRSGDGDGRRPTVFLEVWAALDYEALAGKRCSWIRLCKVDAAPDGVIPAALPRWPGRDSGVWRHGRFFVEWSMMAVAKDLVTAARRAMRLGFQ